MKIIEIGNEFLKFDNEVCIKSKHRTECCELHWADFSVMANYNINTATGKEIDIYKVDFDENIKDSIHLIKDEGFNMVAKDGSKYFVPCYADNNGCYNSDLILVIVNKEVCEEINISDCQQWKEEDSY